MKCNLYSVFEDQVDTYQYRCGLDASHVTPNAYDITGIPIFIPHEFLLSGKNLADGQGDDHMAINSGQAEIEEVISVLTPADGTTLDDALAAANLVGFASLVLDRDLNTATVTWYKRSE